MGSRALGAQLLLTRVCPAFSGSRAPRGRPGTEGCGLVSTQSTVPQLTSQGGPGFFGGLQAARITLLAGPPRDVARSRPARAGGPPLARICLHCPGSLPLQRPSRPRGENLLPALLLGPQKAKDKPSTLNSKMCGARKPAGCTF